MSSKRRVYTHEFKQEAVRLAETSDKSIVQIEADLDIPHGLLNKWKRQLTREGRDAFRGHGHLSSSEAELAQLRRDNELLRQERDILKKALAIFTRSQR
jgi:transposase